MNDFVAIDVETANEDMASICQIGIARFSDGQLVEEWCSLIDPEDYFSAMNVAVHGITEEDVHGAPTFPKVVDILASYLSHAVSVCHTHFDRISLARACNKYGIGEISTTWLDSARVARRTWDECAWRGYGLAKVCERIGYEFKHHHALEDAKAAGQVLLAAMQKTGYDIPKWLKRVEYRIRPGRPDATPDAVIARDGNPEGELYGEVLVFTGALTLVRSQAADLAAHVGCKVDVNVTKRTTLLVVGDQDIRVLAGKEKSSKHLKAEQLIGKGQTIRILKESDFQELVRLSHPII